MKKIEVEKIITDYLSNNTFEIVDSLSKRYTISSYEQYMQCFTLIKTTYQNNITEFYKEGKKFIDKMNDFIENIVETNDIEIAKTEVRNNLKNSLNFDYNRVASLISIHPKSFKTQRECSREAFITIYDELGYNMLKQYINLVKSPSNFSSYMNDSNKQIVAMKFLLFKTNHHSNKRLKRDLSSKTIYQETSDYINESLLEITKEKENFINYMDEQKENYNNWFNNTSGKLKKFITEHFNKLSNLEKTYEEKLKVEKPAEFMLEQANKYKNSFYWWCLAIVVISIILLILLAFIVSPNISFNDKLVTINVLSNDIPVNSSVILLAMISLVIYVLRIFIKMAISSKHLMEEYKQKHTLTYFYLALVNNGNIQDEQSRNIILTSLFAKSDTGLIKNDTTIDTNKNILLSLINR